MCSCTAIEEGVLSWIAGSWIAQVFGGLTVQRSWKVRGIRYRYLYTFQFREMLDKYLDLFDRPSGTDTLPRCTASRDTRTSTVFLIINLRNARSSKY